eukprot:gene779-9029_t
MKLITKYIYGISIMAYSSLFVVSLSYSIYFFVNTYITEGASPHDFIVPFWLASLSLLTVIMGYLDLFSTFLITFSNISFIIFSLISILFWFIVSIFALTSLISYVVLGYINSAIGIAWLSTGICGLVSHFFFIWSNFKHQNENDYKEVSNDNPIDKKQLFFGILRTIMNLSTWIIFAFFLLTTGGFSLYAVITSIEQNSYFHYHGEKFEISALSTEHYSHNQSNSYHHAEGHWKMHIYCTGRNPDEKTPTILLSHGGGSSYVTFLSMQKILSNYTQVCSFDRSGYGYSDFGSFPRNIAQHVAELHELLEKKEIHHKLLFVGHSMGGNEAQFFAYKYPSKVAGIMRMDSPHELYYIYEGMSKGLSMEESVSLEESRLPLLDFLRHLSVFGLTRIITNGKGFENEYYGSQHASLYGTKNWNSQYWDFKNTYESDLLLNSSRWDVTLQSKGIPGQMFGDISLHVVKSGNNEFNKTCADLKIDPNSKACEEQEKKRKTELWLLDDYIIRSSNSKLIICEACDHGFITNNYKYAANLVINQLKEIQNKI